MVMRLKVEVFETENGKKKSTGTIWTDGKKVYYSPEDPVLRNMIEDVVYDMKSADPYDTPIEAEADPIKFVKNLCFRYKSHSLWATEAKES